MKNGHIEPPHCGPMRESMQTAQPSGQNKDNGGRINLKKFNIKHIRILVLILIVAVIIGLYLVKNTDRALAENRPGSNMTGYYDSAVFDLDATANFVLDEALSHNLPVMIDFGADSCLPCIEMALILVELNQELRGKAVIKFVDVWKNSSAAQGLPLQAIPTQFFFNADGSPYVPADPDSAARKGFIMYELRTTGEHVYTAHQGGISKEEIMTVLKEMGME